MRRIDTAWVVDFEISLVASRPVSFQVQVTKCQPGNCATHPEEWEEKAEVRVVLQEILNMELITVLRSNAIIGLPLPRKKIARKL